MSYPSKFVSYPLKLLSAATKLSSCDKRTYLFQMSLFVLNAAALVNNAPRCIEENEVVQASCLQMNLHKVGAFEKKAI